MSLTWKPPSETRSRRTKRQVKTLEHHYEVQLRRELETHELNQKKDAVWYDKELEAQKKTANDRIMAMAVQERAAREQ
eukprot:6464757-Amphidinium_carterae.2